MLLSVVHSVTDSALIKPILCSTGGVKGGTEDYAECSVEEVVADGVEGRARAHCCEVPRRPPPLSIR